MKRTFFISGLLLSFLVMALVLFWQQEWKYQLPTPVPKSYHSILTGQKVTLQSGLFSHSSKPVLLHFFNPDCPCSKFNFNNFRKLVNLYKDDVSFCVVLQVSETAGAIEKFKKEYELDVPVMIDVDKKIAESCGVYSTPQAVLLSASLSLYYRGNYNRSRYCTDPQTNFARMALDSLLAGKPIPQFSSLATVSYGCELPDRSTMAFGVTF